jgi:hypothetical protein
MLAQIAEGKNLKNLAVVSGDKDELYVFEQKYAGLNDNEIREMSECYLNLPDTSNPDCNPLNYAHICGQQQKGKNC